MTFANVFVAGAGFMGSGIAYLCATCTGARVTVYDIYPAALDKARAAMEKMGKSSIEKGFIDAQQFKNAQERVKYTESEKDAREADLIIEAIAEDLKAKKELFGV